ncbi:GNAT family N-acetyltransferase [Myroides sp. WP-1]|uniref:GNAT family N-acetyltransferase n=1 Tax=Myroides sp. WP-1 TaxID=2759944 RepID=UPI0015F7ABF8|nr:GNAT family protein [Myroides sp. WP-1]MBB1139088.1 GNAT family N-acetyltransferase [Myroides sp. WP-1]
MFFKEFPTLQTDRLLLRALHFTDAPALFDYFSKDEVTAFYDLPTFQSIQEAHELLLAWQERYFNEDAIRWAITLQERPDHLIGTCGFHNFSIENSRAEIGYELHPDFWQTGIMTEAVRAIIPFGFQSFNLHRIEAFIDPINISSRKLLEKVGLQSEGVLRDYFYEKGKFVDAEIFSLLQREYQSK